MSQEDPQAWFVLGRKRQELQGLSASAGPVVLELLTCVEEPVLPLPNPSSLLHWTRWLAETLCIFGLHTGVLISTSCSSCQERCQASAGQKYSLFSSGQMLPLIRLLPRCQLFDGTEAFVELLELQPRLKQSSLRKTGGVTGTQQPHVLCRGYFHHPNYTFHVDQRPRLLIKAGWQLGLLITPLPSHGMKGTEDAWPVWWKSSLHKARRARLRVRRTRACGCRGAYGLRARLFVSSGVRCPA